MTRRLLMISTDRNIFVKGSAVRVRQAEYAQNWDEVHIVVFGKGKEEDVIASNCWAYSTRSHLKILRPLDAIRLGRFIMKRRGITEITCQDASLTAMAGISLKREFSVPLEIQVHEDIGSPLYPFSFTNKIRKTLALTYLPKADHIRVVSDRIRSYLVDYLKIDGSKVEVRPIAVDAERISNAPIIAGTDLHVKFPQFKQIALMAARFEKEKNISLALNAWAEVIRKYPEAGLVIVGAGSQEQQLQQLAFSKLNLGESVQFEKWKSPDALASYYKTADLFLNTSLFEGYGMTLAEARAAKCPIVSTDVGIAREVGAEIVPWTGQGVADGVMRIFNHVPHP